MRDLEAFSWNGEFLSKKKKKLTLNIKIFVVKFSQNRQFSSVERFSLKVQFLMFENGAFIYN